MLGQCLQLPKGTPSFPGPVVDVETNVGEQRIRVPVDPANDTTKPVPVLRRVLEVLVEPRHSGR